MAYLEETFKQYVEMRSEGRDAKATLEALRLRIELLDPPDRHEMVRRVRDWEAERKASGADAPASPPPYSSGPPSGGRGGDPLSQRLQQASVVPPAASVGPISSTPPPANPPPSAPPSSTPPPAIPPASTPPPAEPPSSSIGQPAPPPTPTPMTAEMIRCPNCRKPNKATDVFCFSCGEFLRKDKAGTFETQRFNDTGALPSADYFGEESTLILMIASTKESPRFTVRPQDYRHEVVIGRSDGGTMTPDIDLAAHNAGDLGVSRLHVALQYNSRNNILSISDMKSANGTYVNGQKLYPQEVRVLRHGDELRLGRMVLRVFFEHSTDRRRA